MSKAQLKTMATEYPSINSINQKKQKSHQTNKSGKDCSKCGYQHDKGKCPAQGKVYAKCKQLDPFTKVCQTKTIVRNGVHGIEEDESGAEELFVGCIISVNVADINEWYEDLRIKSKIVKFQLDTG